jgi:signal transduction histidine kinase/Tfp pilus assembly protein PilF
MLKNNHFISLLFIIMCFTVFSQDDKKNLFEIWENSKQEDTTRADALNKLIYFHFLNVKPDSAYVLNKTLESFVLKNKLNRRQAEVFNNYGLIEISIGNEKKGIDFLNKALKTYEKYDEQKGKASILINLGVSYKNNWDFDTALKYFEESLIINKTIGDSLQISISLTNIGNIYANRYKHKEALEYYNESLNFSEKLGDERSKMITRFNMADIYLKMGKTEEGMSLMKEFIANENNELIDVKMGGLQMLMAYFYNQKKYEQSIFYGEQCLRIAEELNNTKLQENCYNLFYEIFNEKKDYKKANAYLVKKIQLFDSYEKIKSRQELQKIEISRIRAKDSLTNVAKELRLEIENKEEKDKLIVAWGGSLSAVSIFAFIVFRNVKRKQRKAEEERQKQIEEKEKILKDLELSTINAMIEGQEKERQKLASDLHDSVGATLSAAKLQFNHLIKDEIDAKVREELIKKTSTLLEDAYVEIRSMAHLKNAGVMAKNGLLPAVEKLTDNASGIDGLAFEVQSFGLDQRLDNSLEISIFRIIQELVTNIIKHANATKGIVHLTNHDDNLNIMIEDNGKGFNPKHITKQTNGMGISSIDKRVEHLDGRLTIDSEKNKGTTIIIDIPL